MLSSLLLLMSALFQALFVPLISHRLSGLAGTVFGREAGSVDSFIPEFWARTLLSSLKTSHVFAAPGVVNRNYEGEISEAGDTVRINSVGRPTISTYTPNGTTITAEKLTTAQRSLVIDQAKYFAFEIDDVDRRQIQGDVMAEGMDEAAFALSDVADLYVESIIRSGVQAANALGTISLATATPEDVYDDLLIPLKVVLDEADVPMEGRYCIIPPWVHGRLLRDDRFVNADKSANAGTLRNGVAGDAAGFSIRVSNNSVNTTGDDWSVAAGHPMGVSYAEQINKTEAYRPESSFADAVKGLHLYGGKVVRPNCIATAVASKT